MCEVVEGCDCEDDCYGEHAPSADCGHLDVQLSEVDVEGRLRGSIYLIHIPFRSHGGVGSDKLIFKVLDW